MKRLFLAFVLCCFADIEAADNVSSYRLGDAEFIAIKDRDTNMGKAILLKPNAEVVSRVMGDDQNPSSINTFVVKTADKTVLIDTGLGGIGGSLVENLKSAGFEPEQIDIVLLTHMHGDHIGGLIGDRNAKVFPNAVVYAHNAEVRYWLGDVEAGKANSDLARNVKRVYGENFKTFAWNSYLTPEILAVNAIGHTPGHTAFEIGKKDKILVIGDIIHSLKVQLADPAMSVAFDVDPKAAADTRKRIFELVSKNRIKVAGMHIPFSGVGYIKQNDDGSYRFESVK